MFCKNCGKELTGTPEYCPNCGAKVGGSIVQRGKDKTISILLAVFLTYWTWLYTYKKDAWKFWTGLALSIINVLLIIITFGFWVLVGWIVSAGLWLWAVIDVAIKKNEWYSNY